APRAALTAAATSSAMQWATSTIDCPVAGLIVAKVAPPLAPTYSPPMKARVSGWTAAAIVIARSRVMALMASLLAGTRHPGTSRDGGPEVELEWNVGGGPAGRA